MSSSISSKKIRKKSLASDTREMGRWKIRAKKLKTECERGVVTRLKNVRLKR